MFAKEKLMSEAVVKVRKISRLSAGSNHNYARTSCMFKVFPLFRKSSITDVFLTREPTQLCEFVPRIDWYSHQAQNIAVGRDAPGQPVKTWDGTWDGTRF